MADPRTPHISANKLGEYLTTASPSRRRTIVRNQKVTNRAVVPRYRQVADPIEAFLNSGGLDVEAVLSAIESLRAAETRTDWQENDNRNTADALECFLEAADTLPTDGVTYVRGDNFAPKLTVSGVEISVRPDFLLYTERRGREYVGALKLHCIRDDDRALSEAGQVYVAAICHQWLASFGPAGRQPVHTLSFSLDLFRRRLIHAPAAFTRLMRDVQAACEDIALLWPTLPEPPQSPPSTPSR